MSRAVIALLLVSAAAAIAAPHVANTDVPRDGVSTLEFREVWHRGHDDDAEVMFGAVRTVETGPDGNVYALDTQLSQVVVFAPDGELLRTLSREGEGPGECRRPEDIVFLPDGSLGIVQYINGRIIRITLDDVPLGSLMPPGDEHGGAGMSSIRRVRSRGGSLVVNGARVTPGENDTGMVRTQYLVRCDDEATPLVEYLSTTVPSNLMRDGWIEHRNYFPSHERWDIDAAGRVLAAADRNEYRITVYEPDGSVAFTFGRDFAPRKRTEEQKQEIRDSLVVLRDGQRVTVEVEVEDHAPAISELHVMDGGEIWVLAAIGGPERPEGVMMSYDVFSPEGEYLRRLHVACDGDPEEDRLFLLGEGRTVLVRGAVQARRNAFGGSRAEEKDVGVHDLKMYAF